MMGQPAGEMLENFRRCGRKYVERMKLGANFKGGNGETNSLKISQ